MKLNNITNSLIELKEESSLPKNIKEKIDEIVDILNNGNSSIKINQALDVLEEIANDSNLETYTRTQVLNILSLLEKL